MENLNVFNTLPFKQVFWTARHFFKKLEYRFLVQSTKIKSASFPYKPAMSEGNVEIKYSTTEKLKSMRQGHLESIRDFKKSGHLFKWIHNNSAMNLSVVIIYSIVDSIIHAFSSSLTPFDLKRSVSSIVESFWFNKERLMLLIFSKRVFL